MNNVDKFINEMLLLDVTGDHVLTLSSYSGHGSNYEKKMKALQLSALNDLLLLDQKQKSNLIDRLNEIKVQLDEAVTKIFDPLNKKKFNVREYEMLLNKYFMVPDFKAMKIDDDFILDLSEAIAIKQGILEGIIYKITGDKVPQLDDNKKKLKAKDIALFCSIVNQSQAIVRGYDESFFDYCTKVINHYKIKTKLNIETIRKLYSDGMGISPSNKDLQNILKLILPNIKDKNNTLINHINKSTKE